eukprot:1156982-Pelagomonas_calceolata.AAC.5
MASPRIGGLSSLGDERPARANQNSNKASKGRGMPTFSLIAQKDIQSGEQVCASSSSVATKMVGMLCRAEFGAVSGLSEWGKRLQTKSEDAIWHAMEAGYGYTTLRFCHSSTVACNSETGAVERQGRHMGASQIQ